MKEAPESVVSIIIAEAAAMFPEIGLTLPIDVPIDAALSTMRVSGTASNGVDPARNEIYSNFASRGL